MSFSSVPLTAASASVGPQQLAADRGPTAAAAAA
jgi:hypothetical protein